MRTTELADELADKLEERSSNYTYHGHYNKEAASMLRQQAKEIKALKEIINNGVSLVKKASEK
jgi:hypothetical protein